MGWSSAGLHFNFTYMLLSVLAERTFFMLEELRQELLKGSQAALQIMPGSQLPQLDN